MEILQNRVNSFSNCGIPYATQLAQAGFYLAGSDRVACYLCSVVINNWKDGQDPLQRHREEFVECPLVIALSKNGRKTTAELRVARRATFGKWWPHKDKPLRLLPSKLAEAGFIYNPSLVAKDRVSCPSCDFEYQNWNEMDDPLTLHINSKKECNFVMEVLENKILNNSKIVNDINLQTDGPRTRSLSISKTKGTKNTDPDFNDSKHSVAHDGFDQSSLFSGSTVSINSKFETISSSDSDNFIEEKSKISKKQLKHQKTNSFHHKKSSHVTDSTTKSKKNPHHNDSGEYRDNNTSKPKKSYPNHIISTAAENKSTSQSRSHSTSQSPRTRSTYFITSDNEPNTFENDSHTKKSNIESKNNRSGLQDHILPSKKRRIYDYVDENANIVENPEKKSNDRVVKINMLFDSLRSISSSLETELKNVLNNDNLPEHNDNRHSQLILENKKLASDNENLLQQLNTLHAEKINLTEPERHSTIIRQLKTECEAWKSAWEVIQKENDRLRTSAKPNSQVTSQRNTGIISLSPTLRRIWYESELSLFESRLNIISESNYSSQKTNSLISISTPRPFLYLVDIPWPISPVLPISSPITLPMITSFLLPDLGSGERSIFISKIREKFSISSVTKWISFVVEKEQDRVKKRCQETYSCLIK